MYKQTDVIVFCCRIEDAAELPAKALDISFSTRRIRYVPLLSYDSAVLLRIAELSKGHLSNLHRNMPQQEAHYYLSHRNTTTYVHSSHLYYLRPHPRSHIPQARTHNPLPNTHHFPTRLRRSTSRLHMPLQDPKTFTALVSTKGRSPKITIARFWQNREEIQSNSS